MKTLEINLQNKFANNWVSVRKAFLDLDVDKDGFINSEDIIRFFGNSIKEVDFNDLIKLIK